MICTAPFGPTPGAPGMLSTESPIKPSKSTTLSAGTPNFFSTQASSHHSIGGTGSLRLTTCEFWRMQTIKGSRTSWHMSLSFETITACRFLSAALSASVPITSSASKPDTRLIGLLFERVNFSKASRQQRGVSASLNDQSRGELATAIVSVVPFFGQSPKARALPYHPAQSSSCANETFEITQRKADDTGASG